MEAIDDDIDEAKSFYSSFRTQLRDIIEMKIKEVTIEKMKDDILLVVEATYHVIKEFIKHITAIEKMKTSNIKALSYIYP